MDSILPIAAPFVVYKALGEGAVLFSTQNEVYYGLNAIGAQMWELLPPVSTSVDELCAAVVRLYPEVDPEVIRGDVRDLLAELEAHGLVVPQTAEQPTSNG